jgi:UDP-N-acetylglucosamine 4,6-dehydratase
MSFGNQIILLTGGTGSFGKAFISKLLAKKDFRGVIRIYSRDEFKQNELAQKYKDEKRLRFFIGDVRDLDRLKLAASGCGIVVHAAALKHVPILEYNPFEAVKTNILGSQNVVDAAIYNNVKKVLLISSDKAVSPVNLYGATKMVAEKVFVDANSTVGAKDIKFGVVRYGNVAGSRGSVIPLFLKQASEKELTITDTKMTRFWISLEEGVNLVLLALENMSGGEIFIPKIPSVKVVDIASAIAPLAKKKVVGIRPGEKIHELLISNDEARYTKDMGKYYVILPQFYFKGRPKNAKNGEKLPEGFSYSSENNKNWLNVIDIKKRLLSLSF